MGRTLWDVTIEGGRVAIRCGYCRRLIREVDVDPGGASMCVVGLLIRDGAPPPDYRREWDLRMAGPPRPSLIAAELGIRRVGRGADTYDASPGAGIIPLDPTRYRFVCRGRRHRHGQVLDRPVHADRLLELYRDALTTPGPAEVVLF